MAASWQAAARSRARHGAVPAPRGPRRVSGPVARPAAVPVPARTPSTHAFDRVRALPDHRVLDGVLRSRAWIWLIGIGLGGIVAMQVSLLKLNAGISRAVEASATLERQNAELDGIVARLSSGQRVRHAAENRGMVLPEAGAIGYLTARGSHDAGRAIRTMQPPSPTAVALLAAGGREPGAIAPVVPSTIAPATTTTTTAAAPPGAQAQSAPATTQPTQPAPTPAPDPQAVTAGGASPDG